MNTEPTVGEQVDAIMAPYYMERYQRAERTIKEIHGVVTSKRPPEELAKEISLILISHYSDWDKE